MGTPPAHRDVACIEAMPPLQFPVYQVPVPDQVYSQKLVDLLDDACNRFGVEQESLVRYQLLIPCVRTGASQDIVSFMNDVELTEEGLFERLRVIAYVEMRRQEASVQRRGFHNGSSSLKDANEEAEPDDQT